MHCTEQTNSQINFNLLITIRRTAFDYSLALDNGVGRVLCVLGTESGLFVCRRQKSWHIHLSAQWMHMGMASRVAIFQNRFPFRFYEHLFGLGENHVRVMMARQTRPVNQSAAQVCASVYFPAGPCGSVSQWHACMPHQLVGLH